MAITLGGVSSALVGFANSSEDTTEHLISKRTIDIITCIYSPLAILMMCYALFTYEWRSKFMRTKQVGWWGQHGPGGLGKGEGLCFGVDC